MSFAVGRRWVEVEEAAAVVMLLGVLIDGEGNVGSRLGGEDGGINALSSHVYIQKNDTECMEMVPLSSTDDRIDAQETLHFLEGPVVCCGTIGGVRLATLSPTTLKKYLMWRCKAYTPRIIPRLTCEAHACLALKEQRCGAVMRPFNAPSRFF